MNSSGIKRGLAATAIAALAVTGVPALAGTASANPINDQVGGANTFGLLNPDNVDVSVRNDGTDTTVRLQAAAGANIAQLTFQYRLNGNANYINIDTVGRNDDGSFSTEWNAAPLAGSTDVTIRVVTDPTNLTGAAPAAGDTTDNDPTRAISVDILAAGQNAKESVNVTADSARGVFDQPYSDANQSRQTVIVNGTTSKTSGTVYPIAYDGFMRQNPNGFVDATVTPPTGGATTGTYAGVVDISDQSNPTNPYSFAGDPDELIVAAASDVTRNNNNTPNDPSDDSTAVPGTTDYESYTLYNQTITTVTAVAANNNVPNGQDGSVTVTVNDQNGDPIAGARVASSAGGATQFTDGRGQATFAQPGNTTAYYYADTTNTAGFQTGTDVRSADVALGGFAATPTALVANSRDGAAFDYDENTTGDVSVQVQNQGNQNQDANDAQDLQYYYIITPFNGGAATRTATQTESTDTNGRFDLPAVPQVNGGGSYQLFASLTDNPNTPANDGLDFRQVLTFKAGQSTITFAPATASATAGGQVDVVGTLALADGTGLADRDVRADYTRAVNGTDTVKDAGIVPATGNTLVLTRNFKTGANGSFTVTIDDPAETPQGTEINGRLNGTTIAQTGNNPNATGNTPVANDGDNPNATTVGNQASARVDFSSAVAPDGSVAVITTDDTVRRPGEIVSGSVTITNNVAPVVGQQVTLTVDKGFFTDGTNDPAPADGNDTNEFRSLGQTITVTTNNSGVASFQTTIERSAGFDDDGLDTQTVTARAGTAATAPSDTEDYAFDTNGANNQGPINGGELQLVLSPDDQQEGPTDPAGLDQDVEYDVYTLDQFGNRFAGAVVTVTEDGDDATISGDEVPGTAGNQVLSDFDDDGDFSISGDDDETVTITGTYQANVSEFNFVNGAQVANDTTPRPVTDTVQLEFAAAEMLVPTSATIEGNPETQAPVGSAVTETVTVLDQNDDPLAGVTVNFTRNGPGQGEGGSVTRVTDANGEASFTFFGNSAGTAQIVANVSGGTISQDLTDTVQFVGVQPDDRTIRTATLKAPNTGPAKDKIRIIAGPRSATGSGATVQLFSRANGTSGRKILLAERSLNETGRRIFVRPDRNGNRRTVYFAVVSNEVNSKRTNSRNVK